MRGGTGKMATRMVNCSSMIAARAAYLLRSLCTVAEMEVVDDDLTNVQRGRESNKLYPRLSAMPITGGTVDQTLNNYIRDGGVIKKHELDSCVRELRKYRRYEHSIQIMEWMEKRNVSFSASNLAVRVDLISKVKGIAAAESYVNNLSPPDKNRYTYGALLNCYCVEKLEDKALALFEKMDYLNMASTTLAFNNLMSLYMRLEKPENVLPLIDKMKNRNIPLDSFTYSVWMQSCGRMEDIAGAERVYEEVKDGKQCDWTVYSNLALVYISAGLHEKAADALKRLEVKMGPANRHAFHFLISLNSRIPNIDEVHRIWNCLKSSLKKITNLSYLVMIQALARLNDIGGIKECFEEWESSCSSYDIRLPNSVISAYLSQDMIEEAKSVSQRAIQKCRGPFFATWERFVFYYLRKSQIDSAMKCMEAAISAADDNQSLLKDEFIQKFVEYFKEEKDVDGADEFCKTLKKLNCFDSKARELLSQIYETAGRTAPELDD